MEASMFNIDFKTSAPQFLCHPKHEGIRTQILKAFSDYDDHFIILSSGTTSSDIKGYALSKDSLFKNAEAVNEYYQLTSQDVWGLSLPYYHVGGLSVIMRANLLGSKLIDLGHWRPLEWAHDLKTHQVTITTVVPTQVYDLVKLKIEPPKSLKHLIVGGDYLAIELEKEAIALGWPVIRTFGMTEVCSQLASAKTPGLHLEVLPIHQVRTNDEGRLFVKSEALFTSEFRIKEKIEITPAVSLLDHYGFYPTNDLVSLNPKFKHLGRIDDQIKVSGKLISPHELKEKVLSYALKNDLYGKLELTFVSDDRQGKKLILLHLPEITPTHELLELLSPIKIELQEVSSFERTDLGKLKKLK